MHNSTESGGKKKADVDKVNGSTVNVAHEHQHLRAYTVHASMHHALKTVFGFVNVRGCARGEARGV